MPTHLSGKAAWVLMRVKSHVSWEPQEEGMMSTAASFPSVRNQGLIEPVGNLEATKVVGAGM